MTAASPVESKWRGDDFVTDMEAEREAFGRPVAETYHGQIQNQAAGSAEP